MSLHHITTREKVIVMIAVMSALFLVALDQTIIATAITAISQEFNSFSSIGFIITAYMLTTTITTPIAGKLSDMYGRRLMLLIGVTIFTVGSFLSGHAGSISELVAFRALQGIGGGIITANAFTIIGDLFSPRERGKWQGLIGAVFGMSSVIGPLLGGWLTDGAHIFGTVTDWRWTFYVNVPIGIIALIVIAKYCPSFKHDSEHHPDYLGAAVLSVALASLVLAVDNTEIIFTSWIDGGMTLGAIKALLFGVSALAFMAFIFIERRARQPIVSLDFYKNRTFVLVTSSMLLFGAAFMGSILYLTQFNQQVFGATATTSGLMLLPFVGGMMVSSITAGQLASRTGHYKRFMVAGMAIAAVAMFTLVGLEPNTPFWQEAIRMVFVGLGLGMVMPLMNLAVQNEFGQKDLGSVTSTVQLTRGLGSTIGTAVMSGILTTGIAAVIGNANNIPYIQTLEQAPQSKQMLGDTKDLSADTLLAINTQKDAIKATAEKAIAAEPAPQPVKDKQMAGFVAEQNDFSTKVIDAFTKTLHHIFVIAGVLMTLALILICLVKERPLRGGVKATPGE